MLLAASHTIEAFAADIPDTRENRMAAARSYLKVVPVKDMMRDMIAESAKKVPETTRSEYVKAVLGTLRVDVIENAALASMAQHFTVRELNALTAFYGSQDGQSAMRKFSTYMADLMPAIQKEMIHVQRQLESQARQKR